MKHFNWISVDWDPASECFMVDLWFEAGPPGHQQFHFALGRTEALQMKAALIAATSRRAYRKRLKKKPCEERKPKRPSELQSANRELLQVIDKLKSQAKVSPDTDLLEAVQSVRSDDPEWVSLMAAAVAYRKRRDAEKASTAYNWDPSNMKAPTVDSKPSTINDPSDDCLTDEALVGATNAMSTRVPARAANEPRR